MGDPRGTCGTCRPLALMMQAAGADRHVHALARHLLGDRLADAVAAACHDRHLAGQSLIEVLALPRHHGHENRKPGGKRTSSSAPGITPSVDAQTSSAIARMSDFVSLPIRSGCFAST